MLDHMILTVSDIKRSLAFYETVLTSVDTQNRPLVDTAKPAIN